MAYEFVWAERCWHTHVEPLRDDNRQIIGVIGIALDVTERKQAEEAARAGEAQAIIR